MAKSPSPRNARGKKTGTRAKRAVSPAEKSGRRKLAPQEPVPEAGIIDSRTQRTIASIICIVAALALLLVVVWPTNAVVTSFLSLALRRCFGIGAYVLPFVLAVVGVSFVMKFDSEHVPLRSVIGFALIFLGFLILLALFTPGAVGEDGATMAVFDENEIIVRGGYVGAGPAFAGLALAGLPISVILGLGIMAVGFSVIGFSIRKLARVILQKRVAMEARRNEELSSAPDSPYIPASGPIERKPRNHNRVDSTALTRAIPEDDEEVDPELEKAQTRLLAEEIEGDRRKPASRKMSASLTRKLGSKEEAAPSKKEREEAVADEGIPASSGDFELPSRSLLKVSKERRKSKAFENELRSTAERLQKTLEDFGIRATVVDWVAGPTVTLFEIDLPPGVRVNRIMSLSNDIALTLAAPGVRIFAPIPGTHYVGIEVPNATRENVLLGDILGQVRGGPLEVAIGKDVEGNPVVEDLAKMPHLLIGGTTGSGKSVGINAMIMSILMRSTPSQVRFIMIDPKRVEFAPYDGIPHLYVPVVTEPKEAASALAWGVAEMELRLKTFQSAGVRNIATYNGLVKEGKLRAMMEDGSLTEAKFPQQQYIDTPMPYIVIVIDELADLMMNVGKEVEFSISRIAQLARAAGIHLIVATQRPSANVVTGLIKANITTRIAFNVASGLDSRVVLDTTGAESLIGNGDLLLSKPEFGKPLRVQGCYTSDEEIAAVVEAVKSQGEPEYHSEILKTNVISLGDSAPDGSGGTSSTDDPLVWEAAEIVVSSGMGSTSNIQRKLKVGYARAGRIMDMLEEKGVVGPPNGSKPRDVLVDAMELETLKAFEAADEE